MHREETVDYNIKAAWHAISRMYNQQAAMYDATMSMGFVLLTIDVEEGTPATKIAPLMGLEARSLTRLLKTLEEKEIIYRQADDCDKRMVRIYLTKEGKEKREKARQTVLKFNNTVFEQIPKYKLDVFFEVLQDISQIIETNNIYDKGHCAPTADFNCTKEMLYKTFTYANCVLQHERLNRGVWRLLESYERNLAATNTVNVEIRMVYSTTSLKLPSGATVPDGFYKIIKFGNKTEKYYFPNTSPTSSDFKTYLIK